MLEFFKWTKGNDTINKETLFFSLRNKKLEPQSLIGGIDEKKKKKKRRVSREILAQLKKQIIHTRPMWRRNHREVPCSARTFQRLLKNVDRRLFGWEVLLNLHKEVQLAEGKWEEIRRCQSRHAVQSQIGRSK